MRKESGDVGAGMSRREAIGTLVGATSAAMLMNNWLFAAEEKGGMIRLKELKVSQHSPVPLSFDPAKLSGISGKLIALRQGVTR
ncbi:MAG: hypothetical protein WC889_10270 [Myxococcota bacterium]